MNLDIVVLIVAMAAVTYIPRVVPFFAFSGKLPPFIEGVLRNVPFAILGALIFPAVLFIDQGNILFGILGVTVAFLLGFAGFNVMVVVLGSIGILTFYSLFF